MNFSLKKIKIFFLILCVFFLGAHFHKQHLWPFGMGYYGEIKNFKKSFINSKKLVSEEAHKAEEARKAEEANRALLKDIRKSQIHNLLIKDLGFNFDHFAILNQKDRTKIDVIGIEGNWEDFFQKISIPLKIFKLEINFLDGIIKKELLYQINDNHRATDILLSDNGEILISHLISNENGYNALRVFSLIKKDNKFFDKTIYKGEFNSEPLWPTHPSAGKMLQYDNENILLTSGEHGYPNNVNDFSKILLINFKKPSQFREVYASGLRNSQGITYSKSLGLIIATDHGPQGGDEINNIIRGKNYGWPNVSYGIMPYGEDPEIAAKDKRYGQHNSFEKPIYSFIPSIGIKAIEQLPLQNKEFPKWDNNFLVCSKDGIYRLEIVVEKDVPRVIFTEKLPLKGCRDIQVLDSGAFLTNNGLMITRGSILSVE